MQSRAWQCSLALDGSPYFAAVPELLAIRKQCFQRTPPPSQPYGWAFESVIFAPIHFSFFEFRDRYASGGPRALGRSFEEEAKWASRG